MQQNTFGHTPYAQAFDNRDVYGIAYDEERASRRRLRLGIIGAGGVVQSKHLPAIWRLKTLWEPVDVVATVSLDQRSHQKVAAQYQTRPYDDYQTMLGNEELDGVIVATPDDMHYEAALACLERDLPILVEKPLTRRLEHAEQLCNTAAKKNLPLMTVANKRWSPPYRFAKGFITDGVVANPAQYTAKFNLGYDYVWLLEQGTIHIFDITRYLMGDVSRVYAEGVNMYARNTVGYPLDNVTITLRFASDAVGSITTSATAVSFKPWERVEVYGENVWFAVEDQYELILYDGELEPSKHWRPVMPNTLLFDEEFSGFMGMIENFLQVIRGIEEPLTQVWDGYRAFEINVAAYLSMHRGAPVDLPLDVTTADDEMFAWLEQAQR